MDIRIRLAPTLVAVAMFGIKAFRPDFLAERIWPSVPLSWFWVVVLPLSYLAAWLLTPAFMRVMNRMARWGLIVPAVFLALGVGLLWLVDLVYNQTVGSWCDACPDAHILSAFTGIFGGD